VETDQENKNRDTAHRRPVHAPDQNLIEGQKPIPVRQQDAESKYSGTLLKPGEGEHFEREQTRMNRYKGISARPTSAGLEEKLFGNTSPQPETKVKTRSGCLGMVLLASALPVAAALLAYYR
jgi:hypothetical protein